LGRHQAVEPNDPPSWTPMMLPLIMLYFANRIAFPDPVAWVLAVLGFVAMLFAFLLVDPL